MKIRNDSNKNAVSDELCLPSDLKNLADPTHRISSLSKPPPNFKNRVIEPLELKVALPPLASYPLETLQASLKKNEAVLNDRRACKRLPDKGKKILESNALIREAIQIKIKSKETQGRQRSQSVDIRTKDTFSSLPKHPSPLSKETKHDRTKTYSLDAHLRNISLYSNPLSGSSSSSFNDTTFSDKTSSSSNKLCFSSSSASSPDLPPPKFDPALESMSVEFRGRDMPLKLAIKIREEKERIHRENALRHQILSKRYISHSNCRPTISRPPLFFDFVEDDSDIDGFSEDEYY